MSSPPAFAGFWCLSWRPTGHSGDCRRGRPGARSGESSETGGGAELSFLHLHPHSHSEHRVRTVLSRQQIRPHNTPHHSATRRLICLPFFSHSSFYSLCFHFLFFFLFLKKKIHLISLPLAIRSFLLFPVQKNIRHGFKSIYFTF